MADMIMPSKNENLGRVNHPWQKEALSKLWDRDFLNPTGSGYITYTAVIGGCRNLKGSQGHRGPGWIKQMY